MKLVSVPVVPAQPKESQYGVVALSLFKLFENVVAFIKQFGVAPDPYNPAFRVKLWFDTSLDLTDPEAFVAYDAVKVKAGGVPVIEKIYMSVWEAAHVNIPPGEAAVSAQGTVDPRGRPVWEIPIRALLPGEVLHFGWGGTATNVQVINTIMQLADEQASGKFLSTDRVLLQAIARKLGV